MQALVWESVHLLKQVLILFSQFLGGFHLNIFDISKFPDRISRDRNIRYDFHGSRSRAKVISFQPIPSFIFLHSPFKLTMWRLPELNLTSCNIVDLNLTNCHLPDLRLFVQDKKLDRITSGLRGKTFDKEGRRDACENLVKYLWETRGLHNSYALK